MIEQIKPIIEQALMEDIGSGDITTNSVIKDAEIAKGKIIARQEGIICGLEVSRLVFEMVDQKIQFLALVSDGAKVKAGQEVATLEGPARGILTGERVALNFLQKMSGIATLTSKFVEKVRGLPIKIMDTRKTTPNLRILEKYAVKCGGGVNHRMGLYDAVLIKDNHLALIKDLKSAVAEARKYAPRAIIEVEANTLERVKEVLAAKVDIILLDNLDLKTLKEAVKLAKEKGVSTEASGGITLENVLEIARCGVDAISIGALTHSAPALDISLEIS